MFKKGTAILAVGILLVVLLAGITGCTQEPAEGTKGKLTVGMPPWVNSPPQVWMTKIIIEDELGYEVEIKNADIGMLYASLAQGDLDYHTDVWPTHWPTFLEEYEGEIDILEPMSHCSYSGLVVPTYVTADSIEDLPDYKDEFGGRIIGIEPGSGIMQLTERFMEAYDLEDWQLVEGSDYAMTASLADAIAHEDWIIVTGWEPHWKFVEFDLKYLEDPKHINRETDELLPVGPAARLGLQEDAPDVYAFLNNWYLEVEDLNALIKEIEVQEVDAETAVRNWLEANRDQVEEWLQGI